VGFIAGASLSAADLGFKLPDYQITQLPSLSSFSLTFRYLFAILILLW